MGAARAACLASAFYDDALWGHWTFPDEQSRARDLMPFMELMTELALGEWWMDMTAAAEAITAWTPPGASYGTPEQEPLVAAVFGELFGSRAGEIHALFDQFERWTRGWSLPWATSPY